MYSPVYTCSISIYTYQFVITKIEGEAIKNM